MCTILKEHNLYIWNIDYENGGLQAFDFYGTNGTFLNNNNNNLK